MSSLIIKTITVEVFQNLNLNVEFILHPYLLEEHTKGSILLVFERGSENIYCVRKAGPFCQLCRVGGDYAHY